MELKETFQFMTSNDYKERFVAEYWQTKIRYEKLRNFCNKIEVSQMMNSDDYPEPTHNCPLSLLREQQASMGNYLHFLELRALIECIDLNSINSTKLAINSK